MPEVGEPEAAHAEADGCTDDCCSGAEAVEPSAATPRTREANPEAQGGATIGVLERTVVRVEGMDCASCAATVEKRVGQLPACPTATVNFAAGTARRRARSRHWRSRRSRAPSGPPATGWPRRRRPRRRPSGAPRGRCSRLASALLFLAGLALSVTGAPEIARVAAYLAAIVVGGVPIFRAAIVGLRARHLDMNVLMSAATVGAVGIGQWAEAASVVVLFAAGNALQVYAIDRTRGAVRALVRLAPNEVARQEESGSEVVIPADEVEVGDTVVVRPGERLAVDGRVVEGSSAVDEAPVTGESVPVEKGAGDAVYSGSLNGQGGLLVEATRRAGDSTLQRIARLVEEAQAKKGPRRAVRGPLLAGLHACGGGRGRRARGRATPAWRRLRRVVLPGAGAAHHRVPVRTGDLHARDGRLRDRGGLQARDPRQGRGGAGGRREAEGPGLRQDRNPHRGPPHGLAHRGR